MVSSSSVQEWPSTNKRWSEAKIAAALARANGSWLYLAQAGAIPSTYMMLIEEFGPASFARLAVRLGAQPACTHGGEECRRQLTLRFTPLW